MSEGFSAVAAKVACVRVFDEVSFELRAVCALVGALRALELLDASVFACDVPFPGFVGDKGAGFAAEGAEHVFFAFGEFDVLSMRWASHPFGGYALDDEWEYACVSSWGIFLAGVAEDDFFEVACFADVADHVPWVDVLAAGVAVSFAFGEAVVAELVCAWYTADAAVEACDDAVFDVEVAVVCLEEGHDVFVLDDVGCVVDKVFVVCQALCVADILCVEFVVARCVCGRGACGGTYLCAHVFARASGVVDEPE